MTDTELDERITEWRTAIAKSRAVTDADLDELESHLRDQVTELRATGLDDDESFLVGVKRVGKVDQLTAEFARVHQDVGSEAMPLLDGTFREAPDEHGPSLPKRALGRARSDALPT